MTDLSLTRTCAEALGLDMLYTADEAYVVINDKPPAWAKLVSGKTAEVYEPLKSDAQSMQLLRWLCERGTVEFFTREEGGSERAMRFWPNDYDDWLDFTASTAEEMRRAIVEATVRVKEG